MENSPAFYLLKDAWFISGDIFKSDIICLVVGNVLKTPPFDSR